MNALIKKSANFAQNRASFAQNRAKFAQNNATGDIISVSYNLLISLIVSSNKNIVGNIEVGNA